MCMDCFAGIVYELHRKKRLNHKTRGSQRGRVVRAPEVPGSSPALTASWSCFSVGPEFNSLAALVNSQLVLPPDRFLTMSCFNINYLFVKFNARPH